MANSTGVHSYSTAFAVDPAGGTTFVAQAEVKELSFPGIKISSSDRTNLSSPSAFREFVPGLGDAGEITLKLNWTKAQYNLFVSNVRKSLMGWKITFPLVGSEITASTLTGNGHWTDIGGPFPEDDIITNEVTLKVSGLPVFTQGS